MKKLFNKLTSGKKKTPSSSQDRGSSRSLNQSNDNIYDVREKDLGKIHKAVWQDDTAKAIQLAKKEVNALDKEKRLPLPSFNKLLKIIFCFFSVQNTAASCMCSRKRSNSRRAIGVESKSECVRQ